MVNNKTSNDSGTRFNKAYAAKLYEYSNDHKTSKDYDDLLAKYNNMLNEIRGENPGWMPYTCLDPITALSVLNRGWKWKTRIEICQKLEDIFGQIGPRPNSFTSIPLANNQNTACIYGSKKPDSDPDGKEEEKYRNSVDRVWKGFRVFVEYSRGKTDDNTFVEAFNDLMEIKGFGIARLTMALYWIDSEFYLSLDKYNRESLSKLEMPYDWKNNYDGKSYLEYLETFKQYLKKTNQTIYEFSRDAWANHDEKDDGWLPKKEDYDPGFTVEDWVDCLKDKEIFNTNSLRLLCQFREFGVPATCTDLSNKYHDGPVHYIATATHIGERIAEKYNCPLPDMKDGASWPILLQSQKIKNNPALKYRIRPELEEAMKQVPELLENIDLYASPKEQLNLPDCPLNVIFYGPPGTGKTYKTAHRAVRIITGKDLEDPFEEYNRLCASGRIGFVTFHQSYSYEEFIEGIRPVPPEDDSEGLSYKVQPGVFKKFCNSARYEKISDLNDDPQVWKVSLCSTKDNEVRSDCLKNGYIRIGWQEYRENITEETEFTHRGERILDRFINKMKIGDLVVSCYSEYTTDAIGIVTGDYYSDETGGEYPQYRKVRWIKKFDKPVDLKEIYGKKMVAATVYKMNIPVSDVLALAGCTPVDADNERYVFVIDEINRGNIARIFGELITLLEPSKREGNKEGLSAILPYSGDKFSVPKNVYIIGTMNTADKSLVSLDTALRRRFVFEEMMPDYELLSEDIEGVNLKELLEAINERIEILYDRDHVIGHSYFMGIDSIDGLRRVFKERIIPLLQEYFLDDFEKIGQVLSCTGKVENSPIVVKKDYNGRYRDISKQRYMIKEGEDISKEDFISLYTQTSE